MEGVKIEEIQGRGRSVIASQPLKAGQVILRDSPILLYPAIPLQGHPHNRHYCSHCFRVILSGPRTPCSGFSQCPSCPEDDKALFCSPNCRSEAAATSHTPWACHAIVRLRHCLSPHPEELQVQARFLVAAYNLAMVFPSRFRSLLSLQGGGGVGENAVFLHSVVSSTCRPPLGGESFCLEVTAALLEKDKVNAFGLMENPLTGDGAVGSRSVRAYGIYPNASLFNHDCLPNACRFDYIDHTDGAAATSSSSGANTDIVIRMIHDVPQGREICLCYFPVNLNHRERQLRLKDDYGFICSCDRCQVEANWSSSEDDDDIEEELTDGVAMDEDEDDNNELMEAGEDDDGIYIGTEGNENGNDFPHAYFFLRYMCTRENCWGTLAPLPTPASSNGTRPPSISKVIMECNVCGSLKKGEQEETEVDSCLS